LQTCRATIDDIPKDLDKEECERWLWRKQIVRPMQFADLRSTSAFPSFHDLPGDNDISLEHFDSACGLWYKPRKNWCFIAEIVDVTNFVRLRLTVKDKNDHIVPVAFYTDSRGLELGPSSVKNGFTVAILHAVQHGFLDLTVGIRHETRIALRVRSIILSRDHLY
jgi:hypothetical protein